MTNWISGSTRGGLPSRRTQRPQERRFRELFIHITKSHELIFLLDDFILKMGKPESRDEFYAEFNSDPMAVRARLEREVRFYKRLMLGVSLVFAPLVLVSGWLPFILESESRGFEIAVKLLVFSATVWALLFSFAALMKRKGELFIRSAFSPIDCVVDPPRLEQFLRNNPAVQARFQQCNLKHGFFSGHAAFVDYISKEWEWGRLH